MSQTFKHSRRNTPGWGTYEFLHLGAHAIETDMTAWSSLFLYQFLAFLILKYIRQGIRLSRLLKDM